MGNPLFLHLCLKPIKKETVELTHSQISETETALI